MIIVFPYFIVLDSGTVNSRLYETDRQSLAHSHHLL